MSLIKPGEVPLESKIEELLKVVQAQGQLLGLFDQYMLMQKKFFDQIQINEPKKVAPTPEIPVVPKTSKEEKSND